MKSAFVWRGPTPTLAQTGRTNTNADKQAGKSYGFKTTTNGRAVFGKMNWGKIGANPSELVGDDFSFSFRRKMENATRDDASKWREKCASMVHFRNKKKKLQKVFQVYF